MAPARATADTLSPKQNENDIITNIIHYNNRVSMPIKNIEKLKTKTHNASISTCLPHFDSSDMQAYVRRFIYLLPIDLYSKFSA